MGKKMGFGGGGVQRRLSFAPSSLTISTPMDSLDEISEVGSVDGDRFWMNGIGNLKDYYGFTTH
ncbi:MAG: hypothetical protein HY700_17715 [Gemmatimonadetes bacterium]|nr:hypothetical protein [Gemmatimonadota bacterium]